MVDVQNEPDWRGIKIQRTGVTGVHLPLLILNQPVLAEIRFTVALDAKIRGTHMSRLIEILTDWSAVPLAVSDVEKILLDALEKLDTDFAAIKLAFKYFVKRTAPVSGRAALLDVDCEFAAELSRGGKMKFALGLAIPFTSLCPCSREISDFGAHNQRSICRVKINFADAENCDLEKIIALIERQGSSKIYPVLKREDEKFVTEAAYQNPKFVEDILRDVVLAVRQIENVAAFEVECENFESIHNHNAFASHAE